MTIPYVPGCGFCAGGDYKDKLMGDSLYTIEEVGDHDPFEDPTSAHDEVDGVHYRRLLVTSTTGETFCYVHLLDAAMHTDPVTSLRMTLRLQTGPTMPDDPGLIRTIVGLAVKQGADFWTLGIPVDPLDYVAGGTITIEWPESFPSFWLKNAGFTVSEPDFESPLQFGWFVGLEDLDSGFLSGVALDAMVTRFCLRLEV